MICKYKHYEIRLDRNLELPKNLCDLPEDFTELPLKKSIYHNQSKKKSTPNKKFVGPIDEYGGSKEAVYTHDGKFVQNSLNGGTYNFKSSADPSWFVKTIGHFFYDIIPYFIWGNAPDDPTNFFERLFCIYKGKIPENESLSLQKKTAKLLKKMEANRENAKVKYRPKLIFEKKKYISKKYSNRQEVNHFIAQLGDEQILQLRHKDIYNKLKEAGFIKK